MYKPTHFAIHELVPPAVFQERGESAWQLLDDRMLMTLDRLRKRYGPITVNNYHWGGEREWSGLRTTDSPFGTQYSQHRFGRAADCLFQNISTDEVRNEILAFPDHRAFALIGSVERGTSWLHFDVRNCDRIMTYYP